ARAAGVPPAAVREGMRAYRPEEHRTTDLGEVGGVRCVNDSKATNPHAAAAALAAYPSIVWVAGGQLKDAQVEELVRQAAPRLRAAVLLGQDRGVIAAALARHAPHLPVEQVAAGDTEDVDAVMDRVVGRALELARPGDTVLLAPAAASLDMFPGYGDRGRSFTEAVRRRQQAPPGAPGSGAGA
uniref:glutamate ligase domain-containing protein n=1 Tax=Ornithinicoccus halotolerans TaxID=1748220 RepID=UPI002B206C74